MAKSINRKILRRISAAAAGPLAVAVIGLLGLGFGLGDRAKAQQSTYYVDQSHLGASDSNPGTEALPWLTIEHAAETATAGDTVYVKTGYYPERIQPEHSGSPGLKITFAALPRRSVTMFGFYTLDSDHLRIEGFNITSDPSLTGWTEANGVFIRSDYVEVVDNYFYDIPSTAIQGYWHEPYPQAAYIADNSIYRSQMGIGIHGYEWLVEGNEVERLYDYGGGDCDYSRFFGDDHAIRGNHFHGTDFDEIGDAHVDCFQTFDNNGEFGHNITVEGNLCSEFHQGFMGEAHYYHDISHITFRNNIFAHGLAWGLAVEDISYLTVVNNTFVDIQHHGVGLSGAYAHDATIRNNIFYDTGTSYWFPENSNSYGDYNLVYLSNDPPEMGAHDLVGEDPLFLDFAGDDFRLSPESPARNSGEPLPEVPTDIDGTPRPQEIAWDRGAYEFQPALDLRGTPADGAIHLSWDVNVTIPVTATWEVSYIGIPGSQPSPVTGIPGSSRAYTLTGLTNYTWYSVTLRNVIGGTPGFSQTVTLMPAAIFVYLGLVKN